MKEYLDNSNIKNIFDNENIDKIFYNNLAFTNGFCQYNNKKNNNKFYIKKHIKNNSIKNNENFKLNEISEIKNNETNCSPLADITGETYRIETIPIYNMNSPKSMEKIENLKFTYRNNSNLNSYTKNLSKTKNKKINKNISNSSIDEINISLKQLGNLRKNNSQTKVKSRNEEINRKILKSLNTNENSKNNTSLTKLNYKTKIKKPKINTSVKKNKNTKIFNKLAIKKESQIKFINKNDNNNKIIFLKKIIYKQNNSIKLLKEQNKNLIEKMRKMQEENESILELINSIQSDIFLSNINNDINKIGESYINPRVNFINKCLSEPNKKNNFRHFKENLLKSKKIIYTLYDNKNILSFDLINKKFNFIPILNQEFIYSFNKEINTLYSYNIFEDKIYVISGYNNDLLFIYNIKENQMKKFSNLKNNHMFGSLFILSNNNKEKEKLICLSGKYCKKVEIYIEDGDCWNDKMIVGMIK